MTERQRRRPYPTRQDFVEYALAYQLAEQEGRICTACEMNIALAKGGFCVGCSNAKLLRSAHAE